MLLTFKVIGILSHWHLGQTVYNIILGCLLKSNILLDLLDFHTIHPDPLQ